MKSLAKILQRHIHWSRKTFGPGRRTLGIIRHIEKEIAEVVAAPLDLEEWIDIVILALDGAWRAGFSSEEIERKLVEKMELNMTRTYPSPIDEDTSSEHSR